MARRWPRVVDLGVLAVLVAATAGVLLAPGVPRPVEWVLGVPFLVLYPGYAIVAALFPRAPDQARPPWTDPAGGPGWIARVALAIGVSGVAVATIGVVLGWTVGYDLRYVVAAVGGLTLAGVVVAALRRQQYPLERRADPLVGGVAYLRSSRSGFQTFAMAIAVVALLSAVAYAGTTPPPREGFTEFSLLVEDGEGQLVATDYPREFVAGQGQPLQLAVENQEGRAMDYEVVVLAQTVGPDGSVTNEERVDRFGVEVPAGERTVVERQIAPTTPNEGVRLRFLLFEGGASTNPDVEDADLSLQLWVDVVEA